MATPCLAASTLYYRNSGAATRQPWCQPRSEGAILETEGATWRIDRVEPGRSGGEPAAPGDPARLQRGRDLIERNLARRPRRQARLHRRSRRLTYARTRRARRPRRQCAARARPRAGAARAARAARHASISRPRSSARSRPASCRCRSTRCSPRPTTIILLRDSRARALVVSDALYRRAATPRAGARPALKHVIVVRREAQRPARSFARCWPTPRAARRAGADHAATTPCFWLYSSGSTGTPKGAVHLHAHLIAHRRALRARRCSASRESDVVYLRGEAVLRLRPRQCADLPAGGRRDRRAHGRAADARAVVARMLRERAPDDLLRRADALTRRCSRRRSLPRARSSRCARCISAGEALPERHRQALDASASASTSSTASARPRCCTSSSPTARATCATARPASPVPGYELRLVDDDGAPVADGEIGEL